MRIENWRIHLKKMKGNYYRVEGVTAKLLSFRPTKTTYIMKFASRFFEKTFDEMPYFLAIWEPVEHEGTVGYNHIEEEKKLTKDVPLVESEEMPHDQPGYMAPPAHEQSGIIDPNQETFEQEVGQQQKELMALMIKQAQFNSDILKSTILRLRTEGDKHVPVAKQIINAINAGSKTMDSLTEVIKAGVSLTKLKKTKPNDPDGEADNDNPQN